MKSPRVNRDAAAMAWQAVLLAGVGVLEVALFALVYPGLSWGSGRTLSVYFYKLENGQAPGGPASGVPAQIRDGPLGIRSPRPWLRGRTPWRP